MDAITPSLASPAPADTDAPATDEAWYSGGLLAITWRLLCGLHSLQEWIRGAVVLTFGLSLLSSLPVLQFLALGYLLEAAGRIARTGKLSEGFIGIRLAARLGGAFI